MVDRWKDFRVGDHRAAMTLLDASVGASRMQGGGGISCTSQCSEWGAVRAIRIDVLSMREVRDKLECLVASP